MPEITELKLISTHAGGDHRPALVEMRTQLEEILAGFKVVLFEDKGFGIGLHYREVDPADLPAFKERFSNWSKNRPPPSQSFTQK